MIWCWNKRYYTLIQLHYLTQDFFEKITYKCTKLISVHKYHVNCFVDDNILDLAHLNESGDLTA